MCDETLARVRIWSPASRRANCDTLLAVWGFGHGLSLSYQEYMYNMMLPGCICQTILRRFMDTWCAQTKPQSPKPTHQDD